MYFIYEYIINENIIKELNSIMSKKINKPTRIIVKKLKFVINDYIPNIFKNVKKSVINEYNYVIKYNENKELLLNEIGMEDLNFDLYDENKDDGSYLIIDVLRIFNSCLKETKVMDYGNSFSIDETLSYCSCRTKFIQKIPRKPVGKGILSYCLCKPNIPYLCSIVFYRGKVYREIRTLGQKFLQK